MRYFPPVFLEFLLYPNTQCLILSHLSPDIVPERPNNLMLEVAKILGNMYFPPLLLVLEPSRQCILREGGGVFI